MGRAECKVSGFCQHVRRVVHPNRPLDRPDSIKCRLTTAAVPPDLQEAHNGTEPRQVRGLLRKDQDIHRDHLQPGAGDHVLGFDITHARDRMTPEELTGVSYENAGTKQRTSLRLP